MVWSKVFLNETNKEVDIVESMYSKIVESTLIEHKIRRYTTRW